MINKFKIGDLVKIKYFNSEKEYNEAIPNDVFKRLGFYSYKQFSKLYGTMYYRNKVFKILDERNMLKGTYMYNLFEESTNINYFHAFQLTKVSVLKDKFKYCLNK